MIFWLQDCVLRFLYRKQLIGFDKSAIMSAYRDGNDVTVQLYFFLYFLC